MLNKLILALFLSAVLVQASDLGTRKSEELRAKVLGHSDIPKLSAAEYKRFLEEAPRPYDVVVFFTAPNCNMCDEVEAELTQVANLYKNSGAIYPINDENKKQRAVYFVKVSFEAATKEIFVGLQFRSVPNILVSTPKILRLRDNEKVEHYRSFLWQISMSDGTLTSQKLLDHVNKKTGRSVEYKESILNLFIVLIFLGGFLAAGVFAFLKFRPFFLSSKLWMVGSMVVYFICMSGIVYNIIHNVPFNNVDRDGNVEWFHSGGRSQFGAEGYIMSGTISVLGLLLILLLQLPKYTESTNGKIIYLGIFLLIFLLLKWVESIYKWKSSFYNPIFFPPAHYMHGPLSNDQGNNI
jgi:oligosaccharyltransferase complex subunit gamma